MLILITQLQPKETKLLVQNVQPPTLCKIAIMQPLLCLVQVDSLLSKVNVSHVLLDKLLVKMEFHSNVYLDSI